MKLVSCHVENFGGLSDFDYIFAEGLTVIHQPNGFGKSTLAVFIKAMLYGLPRTGGRFVSNNERTKYAPWQGGRFGGSLVFEFEGIQYRVTRYFGKTAAGDKFSLYDLTHRAESDRFSKQLGEELFKLDVDSFSRSTYLPQERGAEGGVTNSIRTKLSHLVDDTNDMNNYETAVKSLKDARRTYQNYKGGGAEIERLQIEIYKLEQELTKAQERQTPLLQTRTQLADCEAQKAAAQCDLDALRAQIRAASTMQAVKQWQAQRARLEAEVSGYRRDVQTLEERYPKGIPSAEELVRIRAQLQTTATAQEQLAGLTLSAEDEDILRRDEARFSNTEQTRADIRNCQALCNELAGLRQKSALLTLTEEETQKYQKLQTRFAQGCPTETELDNAQRKLKDLQERETEKRSAQLPQEDAQMLTELDAFFARGVVSQERLSECQNHQRQLERLLQERDAAHLPETEQERLHTLTHIFASRIPKETEIQEKQQNCRRIDELKGRKALALSQNSAQGQNSRNAASKTPAILGVIGAVLLLVGVVCFILSSFVAGAVCTVVGFCGFLAAFFLHTRNFMQGKTSAAGAETLTLTDAENQDLYELQRTVRDFLLEFYPQAASPNEQLVQLLMDCRDFAALRTKAETLTQTVTALTQRIQPHERAIHELFTAYFAGEPYAPDFVDRLQQRLTTYELLQKRVTQLRRKEAELDAQIQELRHFLCEMLKASKPEPSTEELHALLQQLAADAESYQRLQQKAAQCAQKRSQLEAQIQDLCARIEACFTEYGILDTDESYALRLDRLRIESETYRNVKQRADSNEARRRDAAAQSDAAKEQIDRFLAQYALYGESTLAILAQAEQDRGEWEHARRSLQTAEEKLEEFCRTDCPVQESRTELDELPPLETLQAQEEQRRLEIDRLSERQNELTQRQAELRQCVEKLPQLSDEMERLSALLHEDEEKRDLLDAAIEYLDTAKDRLANSYVGTVEHDFRAYAGELLGDFSGKVSVDKDMNILVEGGGEQREVAYFSTGMTDAIAVCMRLALIDALFTEEEPFLILDDPFVNLDDKNTAQALALLRKIAQRRQIIYLVCNQSRCVSE